jgi:hypothetical protein
VIDIIFFGNNRYLAYASHEGTTTNSPPNDEHIKVTIIKISDKSVVNTYFKKDLTVRCNWSDVLMKSHSQVLKFFCNKILHIYDIVENIWRTYG